MELSLCMIVKDEAATLPRCLESVRAVVDEMIVLDTGSSDRTAEIARSFGAQVYEFVWDNDFSMARNASLQYAQGEWILVLDADEALVPQMAASLKQAMQQEQAIVINLVRQEIGATQSPYSLVSRLFRNHPAIRFSRPYHAMVDDSVAQLLQREPQRRVITCPEVAILHYGYTPGAIASRHKAERARMTMEGFLAAHPDDPYGCSKLGALYVQIGELVQGIALLERGVRSLSRKVAAQVAGSSAAPVWYELHYHLGIAYSRLQNPAQAEQHYRLAVTQPILASLKLGAYNNLGSLLQAKGELKSAEALYRTALEIDPGFAVGHYNLGMVLKAQGQPMEAVLHYQQAIALNPGYAEAHQNLGVVLLKLGRVGESLAAFEQAIALHQQHNPAEATRLQQGLREMGLRIE